MQEKKRFLASVSVGAVAVDTRIEWTAPRRWNVVADDGREALIGSIREAGEAGEAFSVAGAGLDPSLLADLVGSRYASLDRVADAIGAHLEGACRIT